MERKGRTLLSHFSRTTRSEYDNSVYSYLRMIILKNLPIYHVTDPEVPKFSKFEVNIGHVTNVKVIFALVGLVEQRIATEVQHTQGALLFDVSPCNDMHFVAVMISYYSTFRIREGDKLNSKSQPRLALLALYPMAQVSFRANTNQLE